MTRRSYPPPEGDYITLEQFDELLAKEKDPAYRLLFKTLWRLGLRISEAVGQTEQDRKQLEEYREARKKEVAAWNKSKRKYILQGIIKEKKMPPDNEIVPIPGIRPIDIDAVKPKDVGLTCKHTIRLWRKGTKFNVLPLPDELYAQLHGYVRKNKITSEKRIFPVTRHDAYGRLVKYGFTVGGRKKVHPHALRRGMGVAFKARGGKTEVLQRVYNHKAQYMTDRYVGLNTSHALNEWSEMENNA